jgi:hypothetical protein
MDSSKSFSVLTASKRTGWEEAAKRCIDAQTVQPKRWLIVPEDHPPFSLFYEGNQDYVATIVEAPEKTKFSNLNASLNEGLRHIDTDYVIFYQDFIELQEDCFEKLLELATPKTFVTTCTPNYDGSDDGRYTGSDLPRPCRPEEWEANVAIAPMQMLKDLGGFDEDYDWGWSWDNVNVAERAAMLGAKFILDESNRPKLYPHEMSSHETLPKNGERHAKTMADIRSGRKPLKLNYL